MDASVLPLIPSSSGYSCRWMCWFTLNLSASFGLSASSGFGSVETMAFLVGTVVMVVGARATARKERSELEALWKERRTPAAEAELLLQLQRSKPDSRVGVSYWWLVRVL